jgi:hypothetical protein
MTGRPFAHLSVSNTITPDAAGERAFAAEEEIKKKDSDSRLKDSYEPSNKRGTGTEREYPQDDSTGSRNNEDIESGNRDAA